MNARAKASIKSRYRNGQTLTTFEKRHELDRFNDLKQYENFYDSESQPLVKDDDDAITETTTKKKLYSKIHDKFFVPEQK